MACPFLFEDFILIYFFLPTNKSSPIQGICYLKINSPQKNYPLLQIYYSTCKSPVIRTDTQ